MEEDGGGIPRRSPHESGGGPVTGTARPLVGTTLFSLTPEWRAGLDILAVLERVAAADCGPALEVIGHQAWRGFPHLPADDERAFRESVERLELSPVALGVYTDLFRRPGRPMTSDEAFEDIRPQLRAAARLGFPLVRATLGMETALLSRVAEEAARLGVVLTFELQGATPPDAPAVVELLELQAATGNPYLGLTLDFSLTTPALPAAFDTALARQGLDEGQIAAVHAAWAQEAPLGPRIGAALAVVSAHPAAASLTHLVAGVFVRTGRWQPQDWADVLPLVRHAHAKFWDPDVESVREPHDAWLAALDRAGYAGAVVSEWGGHEFLDRADADALATTRAHVGLLRELVAQRWAVTA
jgi:sugar phosphate isomerase/epimerase